MNNGFLTSKWWIYDDLCGFHRFDIRNLVVNKQVIFVPNRRVIPHKGSFIQTYPNKLGFLTLFLGEWGFDQKDIAIYVELPYFCRRNWDVALNNQDLSISCLGEIGIEPGHTISPWFIRALWGPIHRWDPRFSSSESPKVPTSHSTRGQTSGPIGPLAVCSLKDLSLIYPVILAMKFPRWKTSDGLDPKRKDQQDDELVYSLHHFTTIGWCVHTLETL